MEVKREDGTEMDSCGASPPIILRLTSDLRSLATLTYVDNSASEQLLPSHTFLVSGFGCRRPACPFHDGGVLSSFKSCIDASLRV